MKWVKTAIGAVIAVSVIPTIVSSVNSLTGAGMPLENSVAGTLIDLAPLVFVAGVLAYLFTRTGSKAE
ncbi:MAG: hypothetical protein EOM74_04115 [Methanomicrobia archaeon]|nr:hypothetical protein [Methanomicrobia archaeon]